jgi:UDP-N-acetylglucosamine 2-epimerase (hydrolysing)
LNKKKILFLTGTRADFGKIKPLIRAVSANSLFEYIIFVTGMHTLAKYGYTMLEVTEKSGFKNCHVFMNQIVSEPMELVLANTIGGLSRFMHEYKPDMIIVHGDRVEALAGAIAGALQNVLVAHIVGGEVSGTIDELIRHSVSKLSHIHFVSNDEAARRLVQMGERPDTIFTIGSPDIDVMLSLDLPSLADVKTKYEIPFKSFAIAAMHPVTTELNNGRKQAKIFVDALIKSKDNFAVIFPNNDVGCSEIFNAYSRLENNKKFRTFPSVRFEYFLTLLKNADYIIGNSSAGVREAPIYGIPTINIGTRQSGRCKARSINNVPYDGAQILDAIKKAKAIKGVRPTHSFGDGNSVQKFIKVITSEKAWNISKQKVFLDRR